MDLRRAFIVVVIGLLGGCLATPAASLATGLDDRDSEPVVLTGEDTPLLIGADPNEVVAFRFFGGWQLVPVQVDERKMLDYRPIRQRSGSQPQFMAMGYADPDTWAEADGVPQTTTANPKGSGAVIPGTTGDPTFDTDDEIAMMAYDAGNSGAGKPAPAGVDPATRTPVRVTDPLNPGEHRFLYLFRSTTGLDPAAGTDLVSYEQKYSPALPGPYRTAYNFGKLGDNANGPPINPEDSTVLTSRYEIGIPGRWLIDRIVVAAGDGSDILDGDKSTVGTVGCGRNELTFSRGEGGFIANIDGPVRAIRSFIGANSGTYTQREYVFYEGLFENRTWLRVHPGISAFITAMDMSSEAQGMVYRNELNPAGFTIDGVQDSPVAGQSDWEQWAGQQGAVTNVSRMVTDIPLDQIEVTSFYQDMVTPNTNHSILCSGDDHSYGAAGASITTPFNNSDPTIANQYPALPVSHFASQRYTWFDGPEADAALGTLRSEQVDNPLRLETGEAVDPVPEPEPSPAKLSLKVKPVKIALRPGGKRQVTVTIRNLGEVAATNARTCFKPARSIGFIKCQVIDKVGPGKTVTRKFTVRVKRGARPGLRKLWLRTTGRGIGVVSNAAHLKVKVRRN